MHIQNDFLSALEMIRLRFGMRVYGYVVMPEHVHLLVGEPPGKTLSKAIQLLKTTVSIQARKQSVTRTAESPFWQARYFDHNVRNHYGFETQLSYIHRNPVKRGLCAKPEDWPWSSFRAWALGEVGAVQVESEMVATRNEAQRLGTPLIKLTENTMTPTLL